MLKKTKEVEVIEVQDIPIDEYDNEDIIYELEIRKRCNQLSKEDLKALAKIVNGAVPFEECYQLPCVSLDDQMKFEYLKSVWDKYTSATLEEKLK